MKKLLSILFILSGLMAKAQIPVVRSSSALTVEDYRLYALYNFRLPVFADTTAANLVKGLDSVGTMINIRNSPDVMVRVFQGGAKKWVFPTGGSGGAVSSVFGRTGAVVAVNTDYSAYYPLLATVYTNPSWIGSLAASKISGTGTVTAGSSKILLGGTPAGASLQPFSIDVNQTALSLSLIGGALSISQISATGTASNTTFLRGDGSWSSPGTTVTGLPNSNIGTGFRWAIPLTNDVKTAFSRGYLVLDSTTNTNGITFYPDTSAGKLATKTDVAAINTSLSGYVQSVTGTTNRLTSTGGQNPVLNVSATFEALLGKVANRIDQNNAATTSAQLASVISDETGTAGNLVFSTSPLFTTPRLASTSTAGYVWTATDGVGNGSWQASSGGGGGGTLVNLGTGFRWAFAGTNNIKTATGTSLGGILIDSSATTLNFRVDSSVFLTRYEFLNSVDSVSVIPIGTATGAVQINYGIGGAVRTARIGKGYGWVPTLASDSLMIGTVDTSQAHGPASKDYVDARVGGSGVALEASQTYTSGSTLTITNGNNYVYVNPTSVQAALTITLPTTWHNSKDLFIVFGGAITSGNPVITSFSVSAGSGQTKVEAVTPSGSFTSGQVVQYHLNGTFDYRIL